MDNGSIDHLIRKLTKYVSFGQPVSDGSIISQRISDPRVPIQAYYLGIKQISEEEKHYQEVWLKKEGSFAVTDVWYRESNITRKLLHDGLSFEQLKKLFGEDDSNNAAIRMAEVIRKSEKDDWKGYSAHRAKV